MLSALRHAWSFRALARALELHSEQILLMVLEWCPLSLEHLLHAHAAGSNGGAGKGESRASSSKGSTRDSSEGSDIGWSTDNCRRSKRKEALDAIPRYDPDMYHVSAR